MLGTILIAGMASLLICMFLGPKFIEFLRNREFGQQIREEGPAGHAAKAGTPTMGGLLIMVSVVVPFLILGQFDTETLAVIGTMLASAALGFADDWMKITKRRSLGVSGKVKIAVQAVIAIALWYVATHTGHPHLSDTVRFRISDFSVNIGYAYPLLVFLVLAGATNGVNLTDGLDGLAAGVSTMVLGAYVLIGIWTQNQNCQTNPGIKCYEVRDSLDLAVVAAAGMGACFGFLWWNASPAKIFMGDTGSLGLGGLIAGLAICTRTELLIVVLAGLFVLEVVSVMAQVASFKLTGKRILRMAPLHHHFELVGWNEITVVIRFWIIAGLFAALGLGIFYAEWVVGSS